MWLFFSVNKIGMAGVGVVMCSLSVPVIAHPASDNIGYEGFINKRAYIEHGNIPLDSTSPTDSYMLLKNSVLTADNAIVDDVFALDSYVRLKNNSFARWLLIGGTGTLIVDNSTVENPRYTGISVQESAKATVTNSKVVGSGMGVSTNTNSSVSLSNTTVTALTTAPLAGYGWGVGIFGGIAEITERSHVTALAHGIYFTHPALRTGDGAQHHTGYVLVDNSIIESIEGAAIKIEGREEVRSTGNIVIKNNSALHAGNGNLLEVDNDSTANLTVDDSRLNGHLVADSTSTLNATLQNGAQLNGNIVNGNTLAINSGAQWLMQGDNRANSLSLNGGRVSFGEGGFKTLTLNELSGSGSFDMRINLDERKGDLLNVQGQASGNHALHVINTGVEVVTAETPELLLVHTEGGDAQFGLAGGRADLGVYSYELQQRESAFGKDWFIVGSGKTISPSTRSVLALFNAAPNIWNSELSTLRSRMGEVRADAQQSGGWIRGHGSRFNATTGDGVAYRQTQSGLALGVDAPLPVSNGQLSLGVMAGYSNNDLSLDRGTTGTVDSYYLGAYGTWLLEDGLYVDGVLKLNRFRNESDVAMSDGGKAKGDYSSTGIGGSLEMGKHLRFADGYFLEPFVQVSSVWVDGTRYTLNNGMQARNNYTQSVLGKVGTSAGRSIALKEGGVLKPYLRVALAHEFSRSNEVNVNDSRFDNHLFGSRAEVGGGVSVSMSERVQLHADLGYMKGKHVEQPWGANVGVKFRF